MEAGALQNNVKITMEISPIGKITSCSSKDINRNGSDSHKPFCAIFCDFVNRLFKQVERGIAVNTFQ